MSFGPSSSVIPASSNVFRFSFQGPTREPALLREGRPPSGWDGSTFEAEKSGAQSIGSAPQPTFSERAGL